MGYSQISRRSSFYHGGNASMKTLDISLAGEINLDLIMYGLPEVMAMERELLGTDFQLDIGQLVRLFLRTILLYWVLHVRIHSSVGAGG